MPAFNTVFGIQTAQAATIGRVTLTRLGSSSHSFEFDTRHMDLTITQRANGTVSVRAPASKVIAPPGKYLITLIDNKGVPSVSRIITFN
jgi:galactose oxidase